MSWSERFSGMFGNSACNLGGDTGCALGSGGVGLPVFNAQFVVVTVVEL